MKVWVTGEAGCIARNLSDLYSKYDVVNSLSEKYYDYWRSQLTSPIKELNIFDPSLPKLIRDSGAEAIIHTANINYDLAKNDPQLALHTHIDGAWVISKIAKELNIPLLNIHPIYAKNFYFETFYCGDRFIKTNAPQHATIELPTVYGKYDSSSYIAKMILSAKGKQARLPKDVESLRDFIHTSEVLQLVDHVLLNNIFDVDGVYIGASTTNLNLETIYLNISETYNFIMDCSFVDTDIMPLLLNDTDYEIGVGCIKNRIIMKDAIDEMIKGFGL